MKFTAMKQGYNRYEVDTYVTQLEQNNDELSRKLKLYREKTEQLEKEREQLKFKLNELSYSQKIRERASEDLSRMAIKEANMVIDIAHRNADFIIQEALISARLILNDVGKLGGATNELKAQIKDRVDQLHELIEGFKDFPTVKDIES